MNPITREDNTTKHISETFKLAALLAVAGGYMDAYSYIYRGKVFANAQTGNIVLLGIKIMEGEIFEAFKYLIPIVAFVAGILVAELISSKYRTISRGHWRQIILSIEILALIAVTFIPKGSFDIAANTLISFVSALQVESFRQMNGSAFASTMCTGNLRSGTECLYLHMFKRDKAMKIKWIQYYGIILFFILGAALGAFITRELLDKAILGCCLLLIMAVLMIGKNKNNVLFINGH
jgi:uncharacterized membrane protein YoaK (UPF0700 family)